MSLSAAQLDELRRKNCALVEGFWDPETCEQIVAILERRCTADHPWEVFPHAPGDALLWRLLVQPRVLEAAEQYLESPDIMLGGSHYQARTQGDGLDTEQSFHLDQGNNTLLVEPRAGPYRYLVILSYWNDVGAGDGPTVIDEGGRERRLEVARGTALFYNLNLAHRGTRMTRPGARRFASWFIFRPAAANWAGQSWYGNQGDHPGMTQFLSEATPRQRCLVGIPAPGHPFWTADTMAGVQARYPAWDMAPYRQALQSG